ncbi:MAG: hypothetical protein GTO63_10430 [Anaerolineae bacterium]|nr:hypothetical protein [Anaerolineae bacterium]NIN95318.1 hypothetical protein [Anaerolineae bacterium]NIQ78283.1 hypothetical protein [Anaerolineae bacterium]
MPVSVDTILLLALGAPLVPLVDPGVGALLILVLGSYAVLDAVARSSARLGSARTVFNLKLMLALLAIFLAVVLPTVSGMIMRRGAEPWQYTHDGAIQIEESIKYLLQGKNPYTEDYLGTPLAQWEYAFQGDEGNPALYHNVYLPFISLFSIPFYLVIKHMTGWYDQRLIYLFLFVCTLWPLMKHAAAPFRKLSLLIVFGLNFFTAFYSVWGVNDSFVMFWLIMSTYLLKKDRITLSALSLGLACASKQTAWVFVPFFLTYVWFRAPSPDRWAYLRKAYPLLVVPLLFIVPFLLWDAAAFVGDTYSYWAGRAASSYPISGVGFGGLLVALGLIRDENRYFPFALCQIAFCVPLLIYLLRRQLSSNTIEQSWLGYGLLLLAVLFFSRYFNESHLGIIVGALALAYFSEPGPREGRR